MPQSHRDTEENSGAAVTLPFRLCVSVALWQSFHFMLGIHSPSDTSPDGGGLGKFSEDETAFISEAVWPNRSAR